MAELIITNGDSAGDCLQETYPDAHVLPWRDLLHEGPVPLGADLSAHRAAYIERTWGVEAKADFEVRDRALSGLAAFPAISLWFEHDLYDQLQLLQVLDVLRGCGRDVLLVQADDYLGRDDPKTITRWRDQAEPVTSAQYDLASQAWAAFRQETPQDWAGLLGTDTAALPHLGAAILRMLEELPSAKAGVSRTQRHILEVVESGAQTPGRIFQAYQKCEEAQFMGDWSFFNRLDSLANTEHPALLSGTNASFEPSGGEEAIRAYLDTTFELSDFGKDVLAEDGDFAALNSIDFWWGGTHITQTNLWRWDAGLQELVWP